jgi:hypothetical protein
MNKNVKSLLPLLHILYFEFCFQTYCKLYTLKALLDTVRKIMVLHNYF